MAKKTTPFVAPKAAPAPARKAEVVSSTPVRNTPIPKASTPARNVITQEQIAIRAFEISCGPNGGSQDDNWFRAERELRGV